MARFLALPRGTQLVLVAAPLLLVSLFFTWQDVPVDYGSAGIATTHLDGFDGWGLLLSILLVLTLTLVVVMHSSQDDLTASRPHATALLALGLATAGIAILKSLTDAGSTLQSYVFVGLAVAVAVGAAMNWAAIRHDAQTATPARRGWFSSAA
jgi:hypothetical protein